MSHFLPTAVCAWGSPGLSLQPSTLYLTVLYLGKGKVVPGAEILRALRSGTTDRPSVPRVD